MRLIAARYELGARIGAGGMAEVVEGYDRKLDRRVAVKLLRVDVGDGRAHERFLQEAQLAAGFSHANVVAVYDVGEMAGRPYLVMELVEGRTLQEVLAERGSLAVAETLRIADALLAALGAAHAHGLVHRDVKPGNVLLGRDGSVKLADFGIAKAAHDTLGLTATGQMLGTPKYLAPETVEGADATPRTDLYAVGVVMFEMLTGSPPFTGAHPFAVALAHRDQPPPSLDAVRPGLPTGLGAIVGRALEKGPARRFASAAAMQSTLREVGVRSTPAGNTTVALAAASETRPLPRPPAPEPAPVAPRRRRDRRWLIPALAALLVVSAALLLLPGGDDLTRREPTAATAPTVAATVPATAPPTAPTTTTSTTLPRTLDSLIALLGASPGAFGERDDELLAELQKLQEHESPGRAARLERDIQRWLDDGELDPAIGAFALEVLRTGNGLTSADPGENGQGGGDGD